MRRSMRVGLVAVALLGGVGCGSGPYPVAGQVVYDDGKPATELAGWTVVFDSPEMKVSSVGMIGPDGRYALDFRKARDGAMPGTYKVLIYYPNMEGPDETEPRPTRPAKKSKRPLATKYSDASQTPLTATVGSGKNDIPLTVERL